MKHMGLVIFWAMPVRLWESLIRPGLETYLQQVDEKLRSIGSQQLFLAKAHAKIEKLEQKLKS